MLAAPDASNCRAKNTCWPMMSQVPRCWASPSSSHASWAAPGRLRVGQVGVGADLPAVAAGLVVAELPGVEHVERGQRAPADPAVERDAVAAVGAARGAQRHVLVVRLVRRGPPGGPLRRGQRRAAVGAHHVGVVVLHLVVVRDHQPRRDRVRGLQVRVGLVLRVPAAVVGQRDDLGAQRAGAPTPAVGAVLVDVVAQVQDQVRAVLGHPAVGGVVARTRSASRRRRPSRGRGRRVPSAGAVRVRPTGERWPCARKR